MVCVKYWSGSMTNIEKAQKYDLKAKMAGTKRLEFKYDSGYDEVILTGIAKGSDTVVIPEFVTEIQIADTAQNAETAIFDTELKRQKEFKGLFREGSIAQNLVFNRHIRVHHRADGLFSGRSLRSVTNIDNLDTSECAVLDAAFQKSKALQNDISVDVSFASTIQNIFEEAAFRKITLKSSVKGTLNARRAFQFVNAGTVILDNISACNSNDVTSMFECACINMLDLRSFTMDIAMTNSDMFRNASIENIVYPRDGKTAAYIKSQLKGEVRRAGNDKD